MADPDHDRLKRRVAALESLVIDLLAVTASEGPDGWRNMGDAIMPPMRRGEAPKPPSKTVLDRRELLREAAARKSKR